MKVSQLMGSQQIAAAKLAGIRLAKLYRETGMVPTFSQYCAESIVLELNSPAELNDVHGKIQSIFGELGFTIQFGDHFSRYLFTREKHVPARAIISSFAKLKGKYAKELERLREKTETQRIPGGIEVLFKCFGSKLNILIAVRGNLIEVISMMNRDPRDYKVNGESTVVWTG